MASFRNLISGITIYGVQYVDGSNLGLGLVGVERVGSYGIWNVENDLKACKRGNKTSFVLRENE